MLSLLERLRRSIASNRFASRAASYGYTIGKRSPRWPFDEFMRRLHEPDGLVISEGLYPSIEQIRKDLVSKLAGRRRKTSFRHEQVEIDAGDCAAGVSSPEEAARLIYRLVRIFKPAHVVEIGSAFGVGTMYISEALRMNGSGQVVGIECEEWRADLANECLARHWGTIGRVEIGAAEEIFPRLRAQHGPFDFAFVDAVHKFENTVGYHNMVRSSVNSAAIVVYDDINWSSEMQRFWQFLCAQTDVTDALLVSGRWAVARYDIAAAPAGLT
jgi:predicted O-methyltransferase YrrM